MEGRSPKKIPFRGLFGGKRVPKGIHFKPFLALNHQISRQKGVAFLAEFPNLTLDWDQNLMIRPHKEPKPFPKIGPKIPILIHFWPKMTPQKCHFWSQKVSKMIFLASSKILPLQDRIFAGAKITPKKVPKKMPLENPKIAKKPLRGGDGQFRQKWSKTPFLAKNGHFWLPKMTIK